MDKLIVLGTGHAGVTKCYNTCFAITNEQDYILVDAGGGNGILGILEKAQVPMVKLQHAFVTHKHTDHVLGIVWIIRKIASLIHAGDYQGNLTIYGHDELVHTINLIARATLEKRVTDLISGRIILRVVDDGQKENLAGYDFTFFDIHSVKAKQFGFKMLFNQGKILTFLGDEPYHSACRSYAEQSDWLLSEAFCLFRDREIFKPYEKQHSTVKEACQSAKELKVKNLVLWHTEDQDLVHRKEAYTDEGKEYYQGTLYVPNDLEVIELR